MFGAINILVHSACSTVIYLYFSLYAIGWANGFDKFHDLVRAFQMLAVLALSVIYVPVHQAKECVGWPAFVFGVIAHISLLALFVSSYWAKPIGKVKKMKLH